MNILLYVVLGLGSGAVYGLLAQGVVAVYRSSGVLNFAQGAIAMTSAYIFVDLHNNHHMPTAAALPLVVLIAALFGVVVQVAVMGPMREGSSLARVCATLGLFITLQSAVSLHYGTDSRVVSSFLPDKSVPLWSGAGIGEDRLILLGIGVVVTAVLWYVYRSTQFGRLTTGVWQNPVAVSALGGSPRRVAAANWALSSGIAGFCGCCVVPLTGLQISTLSMLIVPALAAAIAGGLRSFPLIFLAGLVLGGAESVVSKYVTTPGWSEAVPFLAIVVLFVVRGRSLPVRGELGERLPAVGRGRFGRTGFLTVAAVLVVAVELGPDSWTQPITATALAILISVSIVVVTGYAGQLNLATYTLSGMAALFGAHIAHSWGWSLVPSVLAGAVLAIPVGLVVAIPALRARGANLAAVTLALGVVVQDVVFTNPSYTGGFSGLTTGSPSVFGWSVDTTLYPQRYALVVLVCLGLIGIVVVNLRRGATGRRLLAVRGNERAAASVGIGVRAAKLYAFSVSAFIAGICGVLISLRTGVATFSGFDAFSSVLLVGSVVLGGIGYGGGAVVAGVIATGGIVSTWLGLTNLDKYLPLISGLALTVTLVLQPSGLVPGTIRIWTPLLRRIPAGAFESLRRLRAVRPRPRPTPDADAAPVARVRPLPLRVESLTVEFGRVRVVDDFSLTVAPGEILGLIGPNGAGKTTVIDAITGFVPARGRITLGGNSVERRAAHRRAGAGLSRSFQSIELFDDLTIGENVMVGSEGAGALGYLRDLAAPARSTLSGAARSAVELFGLQPYLMSMPQEVPFAIRRLAGIARSVACAASVVLLDEPAAGLGAAEVDELVVLLRRLARDWGMAIVLVEHHMDMVMSVCDRVQVLTLGKTIAIGTPEDIQRDDRVRVAYLGGEPAELAADAP